MGQNDRDREENTPNAPVDFVVESSLVQSNGNLVNVQLVLRVSARSMDRWTRKRRLTCVIISCVKGSTDREDVLGVMIKLIVDCAPGTSLQLSVSYFG